jgi:hypothetical protein
MYRENMTEVSEGAVDGTLIPHIIPDYTTVQEYISTIPKYTGKTIPSILTRTRRILGYDWHYFDLKSFLQNFGQYHESESWVVAGLLAETGISSGIPVFGPIFAAIKLVKENMCKKQILCKKFKDKIVFLINVTDSKKEEGTLNAMYSDSIMIIDASTLNPPRPHGFNTHMPLPPMDVHAGGLVDTQRQRAADVVALKIFKLRRRGSGQSDIQLQEENSTSLTNITQTLSGTVTYVIDPNQIDDSLSVVEWFGGGMTLEGINGLIEQTIAQPAAQPEGGGGKIRSSKPRVTKTRKSTKRRRQQRRRRTSKK